MDVDFVAARVKGCPRSHFRRARRARERGQAGSDRCQASSGGLRVYDSANSATRCDECFMLIRRRFVKKGRILILTKPMQAKPQQSVNTPVKFGAYSFPGEEGPHKLNGTRKWSGLISGISHLLPFFSPCRVPISGDFACAPLTHQREFQTQVARLVLGVSGRVRLFFRFPLHVSLYILSVRP